MIKLLFATGNIAKVNRFKDKLAFNDIELLSLKDLDTNINVEENGKDAIENALIKARAYCDATSLPVIAMDDNLYLDGVPQSKQPGMFVRRVNGKTLNDEEMIDYYSKLVRDYGIDGKINARWVYGMALISNGEEHTYTWSKEDFWLVDTPTDKRNEGYPLNSISKNIALDKYFTDMTAEDWLSQQQNEDHVIDFILKNLCN